MDINPDVLGKNFPAVLPVAADARAFLSTLLEELRQPSSRPAVQPSDTALRPRIAAGHAGVRRDWRTHASNTRVTPSLLLEAIQRVFGPETIFTTDSGNGTFLAMECLRLERPGLVPGAGGLLLHGILGAGGAGARLGKPDAPVVALAGDGAFLMTAAWSCSPRRVRGFRSR